MDAVGSGSDLKEERGVNKLVLPPVFNPLPRGVYFLSVVFFLLLIPQVGGKTLENNTITAIPGIRVGHYTDLENLKGCTVIRFWPEGVTAAVDVQGSAPGTRETDLLDPVNLVDKVHAVVLSGGSAYGLDAASGVMTCLERENTGFPAGEGIVVPIVPAAVLFDLNVGNSRVRPTAAWGLQACGRADTSPVQMGNVGAGTGATVGKFLGMGCAMKSGLGSALRRLPGGVMVGALVAVNALGDVVDPDTGRIVAGIRGDTPGTFQSSVQVVLDQKIETVFPGTHTTIGIVATNIPFSKAQLKRWPGWPMTGWRGPLPRSIPCMTGIPCLRSPCLPGTARFMPHRQIRSIWQVRLRRKP